MLKLGRFCRAHRTISGGDKNASRVDVGTGTLTPLSCDCMRRNGPSLVSALIDSESYSLNTSNKMPILIALDSKGRMLCRSPPRFGGGCLMMRLSCMSVGIVGQHSFPPGNDVPTVGQPKSLVLTSHSPVLCSLPCSKRDHLGHRSSRYNINVVPPNGEV